LDEKQRSAWKAALPGGILPGDVGGNIEVVRTALTALDQRDVELYLSVASPEIELINPARHLRDRHSATRNPPFLQRIGSLRRVEQLRDRARRWGA
jgi:hypothetical protein